MILMGWRNSFVKLDSKEAFSNIKEFVDHHNSWTQHFSKEEVEKMWEDDEVPGETLQFSIIYNEKTDEFWAYIGSHGGMSFTFGWKEKYFPHIVMYDSGDWPHYNEEDNDWAKWPLYTIEQYRDIKIQEKKKECKKKRDNK